MVKQKKILTINCGSSSIKYKLFSFPKAELIFSGSIEKIGEQDSKVKNHHQGMEIVFNQLASKGALEDLSQISAIGHRVVHGGETFQYPHLIDQQVIKKIKECIPLAPLHNPANLEGIKATQKILPHIPQVAVFDTAFHHTLPEYVYMYPLPYKYYQRYRLRKYGFHGTSHQYVAKKTSQLLGKPLSQLNLIICHLGNGCSISAVKKGKPIDTSMGFTPLEGLMMGTRCGDIDPAVVLFLMEKEKLTIQQLDEILNKQSGLLGISGVSNDYRKVKLAAHKGNKQASLAMEMFYYRIKKYIGAYILILSRVDAVCFTAGIGENNPDLIRRFKREIQKTYPKIKILVVPTNEELMIALLTYELLKKQKRV